MEITGKVHLTLPVQSGQGRNGVWKKQEFVITIEGTYPKNICFSLWGDKIDQASLKPGDNVKVHFDLESREYNGRWYTEARAWKVEKDQAPGADSMPDYSSFAPPSDEDAPADDLPF